MWLSKDKQVHHKSEMVDYRSAYPSTGVSIYSDIYVFILGWRRQEVGTAMQQLLRLILNHIILTTSD